MKALAQPHPMAVIMRRFAGLALGITCLRWHRRQPCRVGQVLQPGITAVPVQAIFLNFRNFTRQQTQISTIAIRSRPTEGRLAIVTDAGRDAVDAAARETNAVCYVRRSRVVLTPQSLASSLR